MGRNRTLLGQHVTNQAGFEETVDISSADWSPSNGGNFIAIWVGVTGDVITKDLGGNNHTHKAASAGQYHSMAGQTIVRTGTTATDMVAVLDRAA